MVVPLVEPKIVTPKPDPFHSPPVRQDARDMPPSDRKDESASKSKEKPKSWLPQMGLNLNPFGYIDAGKDPYIPFYLIDHNQFNKINGDQPSFVFAPAGGGKTAFRVRLARECRAGWNKRRIFPIVFKPSIPGDPKTNEKRALRQRADLLWYAARELFLYLAYSPYSLDEMDPACRKSFLQAIAWDLDYSIDYWVNQMKSKASLDPVLAAFDPTARSLPNPPDKEDILYLYRKLNLYIPEDEKPRDERRLELLFDLILNKLNFEAIFILVDGVDAFLETGHDPHNALLSISWLLDNALVWSQKGIYTKYFLPVEIKPVVLQTPDFRQLTSKSKMVTIKWDADALSEVIRRRLQEASGGEFDSLAAISDRALRASGRSPEEILIGDLRRRKKLSPRSLIRAMDHLFAPYAQDPKQAGEKLTPQDLEAAREWIRREYSAKK